MRITKDDASDLQSDIDRLISCTLRAKDAEDAKTYAAGLLRQRLWNLQHGSEENAA